MEKLHSQISVIKRPKLKLFCEFIEYETNILTLILLQHNKFSPTSKGFSPKKLCFEHSTGTLIYDTRIEELKLELSSTYLRLGFCICFILIIMQTQKF